MLKFSGTKCYMLSLLLLLPAALSQAESPRLSPYNLSKDLEPGSITSTFIDSRDILWIGTQHGLYRFDGAKLLKFDSRASDSLWIPDTHINDISEDNDGNLLVATRSAGLLQWDPGQYRFRSTVFFGNQKESHISSILVSKNGDVWLAGRRRVILHESRTINIGATNRALQNPDLVRFPTSLLESSRGDIIIGSKLGLASFNPSTQTLKPLEILNSNDRIIEITSLDSGPNAEVYAGTAIGDVYIISPSLEKIVAKHDGETQKRGRINATLWLDSGILIGSDIGLLLGDHKLSSVDPISLNGHGLSNHQVTSLEKGSGSVWVGTYSGLDVLTFTPFDLHADNGLEFTKDVTSFTETQSGHVLVGTYKGLFESEEEQHRRYTSKASTQPLVDNRVSALGYSSNLLWIGYFQDGIQILDTVTGDSFLPQVTPDSRLGITGILVDDKRDFVWISSIHDGVLRLGKKDPSGTPIERYLTGLSVLNLHQMTDGSILAITNDGLFAYSSNLSFFAELKVEFGLPNTMSPEIYSVANHPDGSILLGTRDYGLFKLGFDMNTPSEITSIKPIESSGLETSTIYSIEVDDDSNLWCSTDGGIVKLSPAGELIARFTTVDGLQGNDFEIGASFRDSQGFLYFGGSEGYNRFHPKLVDIDLSSSPVKLSGVKFPGSDEETIWDNSKIKEVVLTKQDKSITLNFAVVDFQEPANHQFRYKLDGIDLDWIDAGFDSSVTYVGLPVGQYDLHVQGANAAGIWNREGFTVQLTVLPPPWLSWWAFLIYALVLAFIWWCSVRIYQSYVFRRRTEELKQEKIAMEIRADDEMQEQMEIQNQLMKSAYLHNQSTLQLLSSMVGLGTQSARGPRQMKIAKASAKRVAALSLLDQCLYYFADNPTADLEKFTNLAIDALLPLSNVPSLTVISINNVTSSYVPTLDASPLAIIIYELIENALKHAFPDDSPANYLQIDLAKKVSASGHDEYWNLVVSDTGLGFEGQTPSVTEEIAGIPTIKCILREVDATIRIEFDQGTRVSIHYPATTSVGELRDLPLSA